MRKSLVLLLASLTLALGLCPAFAFADDAPSLKGGALQTQDQVTYVINFSQGKGSENVRAEVTSDANGTLSQEAAEGAVDGHDVWVFNGFTVGGKPLTYPITTDQAKFHKDDGKYYITATWIGAARTFTFMNGDEVVDTQSVKYGDPIAEKVDFVKPQSGVAKKKFDENTGWCTDALFTEKYVLEGGAKVENDVILYGKFDAGATWSFKYAKGADAATGDDPTPQELVYAVKSDGTVIPAEITIPANPYKYDGHKFMGWKDEALDLEYQPGDKVKNTELELGDGAKVELAAQWVESCNVTMHNEKNVSQKVTVVQAEKNKVYTPATPVSKGYDFGGWFTDEECTEGNQFDFTKPITENVEVWAKWTEADNTVTFVIEGESVTPPPAQTVKTNSKATLPDFPSKTGYTGTWYTDKACKNKVKDADLTITGPTTFYGKYAANVYKVEFNSNDGKNLKQVQDMTYDKAAKLTAKPENWSKTGVMFVGWATKADAQKAEYLDEQEVINLSSDAYAEQTATTPAKGLVTLYAVYVQAYTLQFDANFEPIPNTVDPLCKKDGFEKVSADGKTKTYVKTATQLVYVDGTKVKLPTDEELSLTHAGYDFIGWAKKADAKKQDYKGGDEFSDVTIATGDTFTLYGVWKPGVFTATFDVNGGKGAVASQTVDRSKAGAAVEFPSRAVDQTTGHAAVERENYTLMGWQDQDGNKYLYGTENELKLDGTKVVKDMAFTAIWQANNIHVVYYRGGLFDYPYEVNGKAGGWADDAAADAKWLEFGKDDAKNTMTVAGMTYTGNDGKSYDKYTREGWKAAEKWNTKPDGTGTTYAAGDKITGKTVVDDVDGVVTLYPAYTATQFTVTFMNDDGTATLETVKTNFGESPVYSLTIPKKTDPTGEKLYYFVGWAKAANSLVRDYNAGNLPPATADATYYAVFSEEPESYDVYFNDNGLRRSGLSSNLSMPIDQYGVLYGEKAVEPSAPVDGNYTFGGWYTDTACTQAYDFGAPIVKDVYLYAKWIGKKGSAKVPTATYTYSGKELVGLKSTDEYKIGYTDYNDQGEKVFVEEESKGTDAGVYSATAALNPGYSWADGTVVNRPGEWTITRASIKVPASVNLPYNGQVQVAYNGAIEYDINGTASAMEVGTYDVKFTPTKNYQWTDGTTDAKVVKWSIVSDEADKALKAAQAELNDPNLPADAKAALQKAIDTFNASSKDAAAVKALNDATAAAKKAADDAKKPAKKMTVKVNTKVLKVTQGTAKTFKNAFTVSDAQGKVTVKVAKKFKKAVKAKANGTIKVTKKAKKSGKVKITVKDTKTKQSFKVKLKVAKAN